MKWDILEAQRQVSKSLKPTDADKWAQYRALSTDEQMEWRRREGHAEFCRLQRLAFHRCI